MPGQPAWTLTEMLECNLPLCWAGGGDCKVGPALICWRPIYLFLLKPIRATTSRWLKLKSEEPCVLGIFSCSRKVRRAGRFFYSGESRKLSSRGGFSGE